MKKWLNSNEVADEIYDIFFKCDQSQEHLKKNSILKKYFLWIVSYWAIFCPSFVLMCFNIEISINLGTLGLIISVAILFVGIFVFWHRTKNTNFRITSMDAKNLIEAFQNSGLNNRQFRYSIEKIEDKIKEIEKTSKFLLNTLQILCAALASAFISQSISSMIKFQDWNLLCSVTFMIGIAFLSIWFFVYVYHYFRCNKNLFKYDLIIEVYKEAKLNDCLN